MKFHFFGSLKGDRESYKLIFDALEKLDCKPVTRHVLQRTIEDIDKETPEESEQYIRKMIRWVQKSDFIICEVTKEEVSLGYEIMLCLDRCKPVIVLFRKSKTRIPSTFKGVQNERLLVYSYRKSKPREFERILKMALEDVKRQTNTRFTLLLSPKIISFLKELSTKEGIPKSVYIRNLIKKEMKKSGK